MSEVRRVDPRRPIVITPQGLRRIVLGQVGAGDLSAPDPHSMPASKAKPRRLREKAKSWVMAVAHSDRGRLDAHARQAVAAAAILAQGSAGVVALILGEFEEDAAALGADAVVILPDLDAARFEPEREVAAVSSLIEVYDARHVFLSDKPESDGDLGRRLIVEHDESAATHVVEIDAAHVCSPWSGAMLLARAPLPRFILLEPGAVDAGLPFAGLGERAETVEGPKMTAESDAYRDLGLEKSDPAQIPLEEADLVVAGGNGVHNVPTLEALARTLGAAVGASRVAVDDGRFSRDKQIGATGKTVSARGYIAVGISGAVQHLQGIKDCQHVIALNRDAGAPIVGRADLAVIGDAEEVMQALLTRIAQVQAQSELPETP
jgi:electron transfer flavoprotein alpha subunit